MAVITATFVQTSFQLNSGALVVKLKAPASIGAVKLAAVPVITRNISQGSKAKPSALVGQVATFVPSHYQAYWQGKSHLLIGDENVGWSENPVLILGNVLTTVNRSFRVYNAREASPVRVVSVILANADGITLDDPVQPDFVNARGEKVYQLVVSPIGPPVISATVTITTDAGEVFVVTLIGTRTVVVPFLPQKGVKETVEYKTWVQRHKDGTEQRQGFRDVNIQSLEYEYLNTEQIGAYVENFFYLKADTTLGVPYWMGSTALSADATAGSLSFTVDNPDDRGFREGDDESLGLLWGSEYGFEAVQILSIVGSTVNVAQELLVTWPAGTTFVPLRRALSAAPRQRLAMTRVKTWQQTYTAVANLETPDASSFSVYDSLPVFEDLQLARGVVNRTFDPNLLVFNPETAPRIQASYWRSPALTWGFFRRFETLTDMFRFRDFFMDRHGRQLAFWIRSDFIDFEVFEDTVAGTDLRVKNVAYATLFNNNTSERRRHVAITYADGVVDYRKVLAATEINLQREDLTLDAASSQALSVANVAKVSYLVKVRFAVDRLEFTHTRPQQSTVSVSVVDVDE